jgi:hypothetical protein
MKLKRSVVVAVNDGDTGEIAVLSANEYAKFLVDRIDGVPGKGERVAKYVKKYRRKGIKVPFAYHWFSQVMGDRSWAEEELTSFTSSFSV